MAIKSSGGRAVKNGWFVDIECSRTTHRRQTAKGILKDLGIEGTWEHSDNMSVEWGRSKHLCDHRCKIVWPEWVTDEMFDHAYYLADLEVTHQGAHARAGVGR
jgi:hypothetical protein